MAGPEHKNHANDAAEHERQNQEAMRKLQEALGQNPDTQQNFAKQVGRTWAAERAKNLQHGSPDMITRGHQETPHELYNREARLNQANHTTSEQGARNTEMANENKLGRVDALLNKMRGPYVSPMDAQNLKNTLQSTPDMALKNAPLQMDMALYNNLQKMGADVSKLKVMKPTYANLKQALHLA